MKTYVLVIVFLTIGVCYFLLLINKAIFFPFSRNKFNDDNIGSISNEEFNQTVIEPWFELDFKRDIIVFLHIQKTGGKSIDDILIHSFNQKRPCICKKTGCTCRSINGHIWLHSRMSGHWLCGVHPDWTELHQCLPGVLNKIERNYKGISSKRRYRYITYLREPVSRYISEWLHVKRGADWPPFHSCNGVKPSIKDFPPCHKGTTWVGVSLEDFMACPTNPARNRQTYMLADMRLVNCYNLTKMDDRLLREKQILLSAKNNLISMSFFGLSDFLKESLFLLKITTRVEFDVNVLQEKTRKASLIDLDGNIERRIKDINQMDLELYEFAKKLFFLRLKAATSSQPSSNT